MFYLFSTLSFLYISGPDRGSGSTAHPSLVTSVEPVPITHWFPRNGATRGFRIEIYSVFIQHKLMLLSYPRWWPDRFNSVLVNLSGELTHWDIVDHTHSTTRTSKASLWKRAIRISTGAPIVLLLSSLFPSVPPGNSVDNFKLGHDLLLHMPSNTLLAKNSRRYIA